MHLLLPATDEHLYQLLDFVREWLDVSRPDICSEPYLFWLRILDSVRPDVPDVAPRKAPDVMTEFAITNLVWT